ncbi:MAG: hypothetical protein Q9227_004128 [Pyrenula ochraceoflavens]
MFVFSLVHVFVLLISFTLAIPKHHPSHLSSLSRRGPTNTSGLDALIKARGKKYFGTCSDQGHLTSGQDAQIIQQQFGALTPEASMKWAETEPTQGQFSFSQSDFLVNWAQTNNKIIRGHTLLWYRDLPGWVNALTSKDALHSAIQNHVTTLVSRYKGKIYAWDVVNEILADDGSLRQDIFTQLDPDAEFVGVAFNAARAADPNAKLYINDYSLDDPSWPKVSAIAQKVKTWKSQNIPIDGIGSQTHLTAGQSSGVGKALDALVQQSGVGEVAITELDVTTAASQDYVNAVQGCLDQAKCVGITVWGVADPESWQAGSTPLLWDGSWQEKPAYTAVAQALGG